MDSGELIRQSLPRIHSILADAMMRSISAAAGWQASAFARAKRKQRRDQWQAEEQQERDGEETSHKAIVATMVKRGFRLNPQMEMILGEASRPDAVLAGSYRGRRHRRHEDRSS
jgi:hypothetical protein